MTIPAGYAQASYGFTGASCPTGAAVVMGHDVTGYGGTPAQLAAVLADAWEQYINNSLVNTCILSSVLVKFGPDATGPSGVAGVNFNGNAGQAGTSSAVSFLVRKNTAFGGRSGRGRMYVPGVSEAVVDQSGAIAAPTVTAMNTAFESWRNALDGIDVPMVILHQPGAPLSTPTPITSFSVQSVVATQRRRQRR